MNEITFNCSYCLQSIEAPEDMYGQIVNCPSCEQQIRVPITKLDPKSASESTQIKPKHHSSHQKLHSTTEFSPAQQPAEYKVCPHCGENILAVASKCKHCLSDLDNSSGTSNQEGEDGSGYASYSLAVVYICGLFSIYYKWGWNGSLDLGLFYVNPVILWTLVICVIYALMRAYADKNDATQNSSAFQIKNGDESDKPLVDCQADRDDGQWNQNVGNAIWLILIIFITGLALLFWLI